MVPGACQRCIVSPALTSPHRRDRRPTALTVVGEIGLDMTRWPTEKTPGHLARPRPHLSGGKQRSGRTKPSASRAAAALRLAASSLYHSRSALGAFHRHLKARLGAPKKPSPSPPTSRLPHLPDAPLRLRLPRPRPGLLRASLPRAGRHQAHATRLGARLHADQGRTPLPRGTLRKLLGRRTLARGGASRVVGGHLEDGTALTGRPSARF